MNHIIQQIEAERATRKVPDFKPGDTVVVSVKVKEGDRERLQAYEGVVIARSNRGYNSSVTVRKKSVAAVLPPRIIPNASGTAIAFKASKNTPFASAAASSAPRFIKLST